jgi:hypothetical protein
MHRQLRSLPDVKLLCQWVIDLHELALLSTLAQPNLSSEWNTTQTCSAEGTARY